LDLLEDPDVGIVDCRFSLDDPDRGERAWREAAIPGAVYAHLDRHLSDHGQMDSQGRHPLPSPEHIARLRASWGFDEDTFIVCYDDSGGPFAARLWWMLGWIGHDAVAVLDGGWQAWMAVGGSTRRGMQENGSPINAEGEGSIAVRADWVVTTEDLLSGSVRAIDARARARYLGQEEPIDPVAGHIPGAGSMPWMDNLGPDGRFLSPDRLAARWAGAGGTEGTACYCGSGVTACHNILAAAAAGLPLPKLYPPSWSGWITDASRPTATGRK